MPTSDTGYTGAIASMSGVPNKSGYGLKATQIVVNVTAAIPITNVVGANPKRLYLLLQCTDGVGNGAQIYMGNELMYDLADGDRILWDRDHPWTGPVNALGWLGHTELHGIDVELTTGGKTTGATPCAHRRAGIKC